MMKYLWFFTVFIAIIEPSFQRSSPSDDTYVAAVLEYAFVSNTTVNLENYLKYISDAAFQNADIVVFPELTLRSSPLQVPIKGDLRDVSIPYLNTSLYDRVLVSLSRAAAEWKIYVVVQLEELVDCTENRQMELCPESRLYIFNTNVVFDRYGAVIDRYRKINLSDESTRTPALNPDLGVFTTDFGVTFGHFISFDLMFQVPAVQVVQKLNITDVIFTAMWFSALPYLTGSGIFSGRAGALVSTMPAIPTSKLLVARVPKLPGQITNFSTDQNNLASGQNAGRPEDADQLYLLKDPSIISHVSRLLEDGFQEFVLSDHDINCVFRVNMTHGATKTHYRYRAGVLDGIRTFAGVTTGGIRVCSIIECTNKDLGSCGGRFPQYLQGRTASFSELSLAASVPTPKWLPELGANDTFYVHLSVDTSIQTLQPEEFSFSVTESGDITTYLLSLNSFSRELYSFAVWGRVFDRDGQDSTPPISCSDSN